MGGDDGGGGGGGLRMEEEKEENQFSAVVYCYLQYVYRYTSTCLEVV